MRHSCLTVLLALVGCSHDTTHANDGGTITTPSDSGVTGGMGGAATFWTGTICGNVDLTLDDDHLYFAQGQAMGSDQTGLVRIGKDGSGMTYLVPGNVFRVAISSTSLFYTTLDGSMWTLHHAAPDGSNGTTLATVDGSTGNFFALSAIGDTIYYVDPNGLHSMNGDGSNGKTISSMAFDGKTYVLDGTLYYYGGDGATHTLDASGTDKTIASSFITGLTSDGKNLYGVSGTASGSSAIYRYGQDGSNGKFLTFGGNDLAYANGQIYWYAGNGFNSVKSDGSDLRPVGVVPYMGSVTDVVTDGDRVYWISVGFCAPSAVGVAPQ